MALCFFTCLSSDEHIACFSCKRRTRGRDGLNANYGSETKQNSGLKSDRSSRSHSSGWRDLMSRSCHARGSEPVDFLNLCAETTFQSSLNLRFPDVNSFQTSWLFEACPSGAGLVFSPAADREQRFWGRLDWLKYENDIAKHNIRGCGEAVLTTPWSTKTYTCSGWGLRGQQPGSEWENVTEWDIELRWQRNMPFEGLNQ